MGKSRRQELLPLILHKRALLGLIVISLSIIVNLYTGTTRIIDAKANNFRGGECFASQISDQTLCQKVVGFDVYHLLATVLILSFLSGVLAVLMNRSLAYSLVSSFVVCLSFISLVDILSSLFTIPTLFTSFLEGYQSLNLRPFSNRATNDIFSGLLLALLPSFFGNLIAYPFRKHLNS